MYLWRSEDNVAEGPGDWTRIVTFGDRCSYLLSHHHQPPDTENLYTECCLYKTEIKLCRGCFYRKEFIDGPGSIVQFKTRKVNFLILQRETQLNFNFRIVKKKKKSLHWKKKNIITKNIHCCVPRLKKWLTFYLFQCHCNSPMSISNRDFTRQKVGSQ